MLPPGALYEHSIAAGCRGGHHHSPWGDCRWHAMWAHRRLFCSFFTSSSPARIIVIMMAAPSIMDTLHQQLAPEFYEKLRAGDREAFGALVRQYQGYAYALALRLVWDPGEADDIVQDSFVRVWKNFGAYHPEQRFTTWLYAIVTRMSIDRLRSKKRWHRLFVRNEEGGSAGEPADPSSPEDALDRQQLSAQIRDCVERLPRTQRLVFTLRDLQDLSVEEVGQVTGLSASAVKANLWHARRRIRMALHDTKTSGGRT